MGGEGGGAGAGAGGTGAGGAGAGAGAGGAGTGGAGDCPAAGCSWEGVCLYLLLQERIRRPPSASSNDGKSFSDARAFCNFLYKLVSVEFKK